MARSTYQSDGEGHLTSVKQCLRDSFDPCATLLTEESGRVAASTTDEAYGAGGELLWRYAGNSNTPLGAFVLLISILALYWSRWTI